MNKIISIFIVVILLGGCTTINTRMENYRNQNRNTLEVKVNFSAEEARNIIRVIAKDMKLVERPEIEKENFLFFNTGYGDYLSETAKNLFIFAGDYTRLGFFLENNLANNITTITIVEETSTLRTKPYRYDIVDKIRLRSSELEKK